MRELQERDTSKHTTSVQDYMRQWQGEKHLERGDGAQWILELRSALQVNFADSSREGTHAREVFLPLAHADRTTGIQDVECMGEFKDVVVRWNR
jgi:hypothetical protein